LSKMRYEAWNLHSPNKSASVSEAMSYSSFNPSFSTFQNLAQLLTQSKSLTISKNLCNKHWILPLFFWPLSHNKYWFKTTELLSLWVLVHFMANYEVINKVTLVVKLNRSIHTWLATIPWPTSTTPINDYIRATKETDNHYT
jgi:hypothetical protein